MKRCDCYIDEETNIARIFERGEIAECGLMPSDRKPLREFAANSGEWEDWLEENTDWRDDSAKRILRRLCIFSASFATDLRKRAQKLLDDYRAEGARLGWGELYIDTSWTAHTYRASAAWKEQPTLYTFDQRLTWTKPPEGYGDTDALWARDSYVRLVGMADAAHELGMELVFDKDFKVSLMGAYAEWRVTED